MLAGLSWRDAQLWPVALIASTLAAAAVLLLYPAQVRSLGRTWRWAIPGLRGLALGALVLAVLRPVMIRPRSAEEEGAVVLLLDQSMSMGVLDHSIGGAGADRLGAIGRVVSLAESLGRIPAGLRSQSVVALEEEIRRLDSLTDEITRAQHEVEFARLSGREPHDAMSRRDGAITEFLAVAASAAQRAQSISGRPVEAFTRMIAPTNNREEWVRKLEGMVANARKAAQGWQDLVDERLYTREREVRDRCDELARMSRLRLSWEVLAGKGGLLDRLGRQTPVAAFAIGDEATPVPLKAGGAPGGPPVSATKSASDLAGGLRRALRQVGKQPVQAVILFSDGRQVGGQESIPTGLLPSGVPVFTVDAASPSVRDLAIDHVELPPAVFVDESLSAVVVARASNLDPHRITGEAQMAVDDEPPASAAVSGSERRVEAQLSARMSEPGIHRVRLTLPAQEGEASLLNNEVERWVKVLTQRLRVTVIAGAPNWDFRYMRDALSRTPWIDLREGVVVPGVAGLGMTAAQLGQQDLVILTDVPREALTAEQWQALSDLVKVRGGSVVIIPGLSHIEQAAAHPLYDLMPYARSSASKLTWRLWPGQTPFFHLNPTPEAEGLDFLELGDDAEASRRRWDELPGFYRYLSLPDLLPGTRPLLMERDSRRPVLTERRAGNGRAFFFAMNETWRWRARVGERDQDRFWLQLVRYAVDEPYALVSGPLSFDVDPMVASPGERVLVRARLAPGTGLAMPPRLTLEVRHNDQPRAAVQLPATQGGADGRYAAALPPLPPGEYDLRLTGPTGAGTVTELTLPLKIERSSEAEMADLRGDRDFLQRLAEATGGRSLSLDQVQTLPQLLGEARQRQPRVSELPLWSSAYLFAFVLGCLTAEWALRKRFGLA